MKNQHPRQTGRKRPRGVRNRSPLGGHPYSLPLIQRAKGWAWAGDGVQPDAPTRQQVRARLRKRARTAEADAAKVAIAQAMNAG